MAKRAPAICGVYFILCLANGGIYVGSSNDVLARLKEHFSKLRRGIQENEIVQRTYYKYGAESFVTGLLETATPGKALREREQTWLDSGIPTMNISTNALHAVVFDCHEDRVCAWCKQDYVALNKKQKYCSVSCRAKSNKFAAKKRAEKTRACANPRCDKIFATTDARKLFCNTRCANMKPLVVETARCCRQCHHNFKAKWKTVFCTDACNIIFFNHKATSLRRERAHLQVTDT